MRIGKCESVLASRWGKALAKVRRSREWAILRTEIIRSAVHLTKSNVTFDFRTMLFRGSNAVLAGELLWQIVKAFDVDLLVGPGFGAAPLLFATAISATREGRALDVLMVRDKRKDHNKKRWVEGPIPTNGRRALIIDDYMESGSAIPLIHDALADEGYRLDIQAAVVFFDMWQPLGSRQISVSGFPVVAVFRRHDIGLSRDSFDAKPPLMKGLFPDLIARQKWWRLGLNETVEYKFKSSPVIADGAVFCADDKSRVWRHNVHDGSVEWCYESLRQPYKGIVQLLTYIDGSLIFGCYDGTITKLDGKTGKIIWRMRQGSSVHATPWVDLPRNRLFVNTEQWNDGAPCGHLHAMDWNTGRQLWSVAHGYWPPGSPAFDIETNTVVATSNDERIIAVDADSGVLRWAGKTNGLFRGRALIENGRVFIATEAGMLQCFCVTAGNVLWERPYSKPAEHQFLQSGGDSVIAIDGRWHVIAFSQADGEIRWLTRLRSPAVCTPVRVNQYLVVLSRNGEIAVMDSLTGKKVSESRLGGSYRQAPAIADGFLAAAANDDGLKVFELNQFYK
jgi:outer membrane protein assembly factor BamB/orotate phosphoribosyltransferase